MPFLIFLYIALWAAVIRPQNLKFTVVNGIYLTPQILIWLVEDMLCRPFRKKRFTEGRKNGRKKQRPQSLFHQFIDSRFTENFDAVF